MFEQIKHILVMSFQVPSEQVTDAATLTDLGLDSLDLVELSMQLDGLGVKITDDELSELQELGAITEALRTRSAEVA